MQPLYHTIGKPLIEQSVFDLQVCVFTTRDITDTWRWPSQYAIDGEGHDLVSVTLCVVNLPTCRSKTASLIYYF